MHFPSPTNTWTTTISPHRPRPRYISSILWDLVAILLALSFADTFYAPYVLGALASAALGLAPEKLGGWCNSEWLCRFGLILIGASALVLAIISRISSIASVQGTVFLLLVTSHIYIVGNVAGLGATCLTIGSVVSLFQSSPWIKEISFLLSLVYCTSETSSRIYKLSSVSPLVPRCTIVIAALLLCGSFCLRDSDDGASRSSNPTPSPPPFSERDEELAGLSMSLLVPEPLLSGSSAQSVLTGSVSQDTPLLVHPSTRKSMTISPPARSGNRGEDSAGRSSFEVLGLVAPTALILLVESCLGRITLISPPYRAPGWEDQDSIDVTLSAVYGGRLAAVVIGSLSTRLFGPKEAAMVSCVWAAFICFGIALAFLSVKMGSSPQDIKTSPYACLVYNVFFAFSSTCVLVPIMLIIAGVCHDKSDRYKCGLIGRILFGVFTVNGAGTLFLSNVYSPPIVGLLALFTGIYICVLHLLRTRTPRIRWIDYDMTVAPGIYIQRCKEGVTGGGNSVVAADTRSMGSRQGSSSILAKVERHTIANFV